MDLNLLKVFLAIYDARSVSAAAGELEMTQPGVSTALRRLRAQFDDPLFVRTGTGMEPTGRARELEEPIRLIMGLLERKVLVSSAFEAATATNEFRLAMSDVGEHGFLPPIMAALARHAPQVRIRCLSSRFNEIERAMETGELDLALGYFPDLKSSNIMEAVVRRGAFGCFVRPGHPLANRRLTLEEFCGTGHILVEPVGRSQEVFEAFLKARGVKRNVVLTISHFLCVPQILAQTDLIATMPTALGAPQALGGAAPVIPPFDFPLVELKMYWHRLAHANAGHQWLRRLIAKAVRTLDGPRP